MDKFGSSGDSSRNGTPATGRFASQAATAEDLLKAQTVGLVNLNDYRKRRAEAMELKERGSPAVSSSTDTPLEGYSCLSRLIPLRKLICQVQSTYPKADVQEEAQNSRQRQTVVWCR
jgi:protein FAM50